MSFTSKLGNKAQQLRGRFKRNTGKVTGNKRLRHKGRSDEVKSNLKQTGEKVKDMFRGRGRRGRHL